MKRFTTDFQNKPSHTARRESCWGGTCHLPSWGWSVSLRGCQHGTGPWAGNREGLSLRKHRVAQSMPWGWQWGYFCARGKVEGVRGFSEPYHAGTSQGKCEVMSPARAQQARKKDMLPQIAGKTKELRGGMKLQLPRKELAMPPRLVSTSGEEHEACGRCHT